MLKSALPVAFAVSPAAVYALLRKRLGQIIPLNAHLGIEIVSIGDGVAEARLPLRTEVTNHLGTVHATAIFGLAEATSGCAMSGAFAPIITTIRPVAANAVVTFLKIARSDLTAHARTADPSGNLRAKLQEDGKALFDVIVEVRDAAGADIAQVTIAWHVTAKRSSKP